MPTRSLLSKAQRERLSGIPETDGRGMVRHYTLFEADLEAVSVRRGAANRLGFALQLCLLRYLGRPLRAGEVVPRPIVEFVASQVGTDPDAFDDYAKKRDTTRREHVAEIFRVFGFRPFGAANYRELSRWLSPVAEDTDSGEALVGTTGKDAISGGGGDDSIFGRGGADRLFGDSGADDVHGGKGNDRLQTGLGTDALFGNTGTDFVNAIDEQTNDFVDCGEGEGDVAGIDFAGFLGPIEDADTIGSGCEAVYIAIGPFGPAGAEAQSNSGTDLSAIDTVKEAEQAEAEGLLKQIR